MGIPHPTQLATNRWKRGFGKKLLLFNGIMRKSEVFTFARIILEEMISFCAVLF